VPVKSLFLALFVGHLAATKVRAQVVAIGGSIREVEGTMARFDGRSLRRWLGDSYRQ
jgi:hypothetical protein